MCKVQNRNEQKFNFNFNLLVNYTQRQSQPAHHHHPPPSSAAIQSQQQNLLQLLKFKQLLPDLKKQVNELPYLWPPGKSSCQPSVGPCSSAIATTLAKIFANAKENACLETRVSVKRAVFLLWIDCT